MIKKMHINALKKFHNHFYTNPQQNSEGGGSCAAKLSKLEEKKKFAICTSVNPHSHLNEE